MLTPSHPTENKTPVTLIYSPVRPTTHPTPRNLPDRPAISTNHHAHHSQAIKQGTASYHPSIIDLQFSQ